jgi:nanoRNase/pAp phosphatase (c-di-AMP/oligoRNAs hydrolase)
MDDIKAKQQIVEKIKSSTNILVTVSNSPSVDALSAALGLTLLFDKLEKHPTAVFSGDVPPAISFLKPEETFDETTDSLRDFIIALDKEKADHLRYKVEGDSVKIFITPYKTTITSDDLQFSQGDFNVELVIALGVDVQEHLDGALESHGQILHDADIITVTAGEQVSNLGGIDWHDDQASSLSEMVAGLAEALKTDKTKSLLDASIATAFLTGIVAETDRFSNTHTTSRVMTVAAQLMGAGADQQLIASKLQETHEIGNLSVSKEEEMVEEPEEVPQQKESLSISHKSTETLEEMDKRVKAAEQAEAVVVADEALTAETGQAPEPSKEPEPAPAQEEPQGEHTGNTHAAGAYAFADDEHKEASVPAPEAAPTPPEPTVGHSLASQPEIEPSLGGTLNATTEQAAEDARREEENNQNKTILTHSYLESSPASESPSSATGAGASYVLGHDEAAPAEQSALAPAPEAAMSHELVIEPPTAPVASTPVDLGLPMPPPLPDFNAQPVAGTAYAFDAVPAPATQPEILGDILAPESPVAPPAPVQPTPPPSNDPGQFQIPGQQ